MHPDGRAAGDPLRDRLVREDLALPAGDGAEQRDPVADLLAPVAAIALDLGVRRTSGSMSARATWSSTRRSNSGLIRPVSGVPTQCEIPPVASSATRSRVGRDRMNVPTNAPTSWQRRGVGRGGAAQFV